MLVSFLLVCITGALGYPEHEVQRISNGTKTNYGDLPFQVSIAEKIFDNYFYHFCSGSIIDYDNILTSAQCTSEKRTFYVIAGEYDIKNIDSDEVIIEIIKQVVHENFTTSELGNDIAIMKLKVPIPNSKYATPIKMGLKDIKPVGFDCTVAGWGRIRESHYPDVPYQTVLSIIGRRRCNADLLVTGKHVDETQVCGTVEELAYTGPCKGDTGAPLVCSYGGEMYQLGVTSWFPEKCILSVPSVYTATTAFEDWIESHK